MKFPESALVDRSGVFPSMLPHALISPGGWTIGPLVAAVQRRSLTPSTRQVRMWFWGEIISDQEAAACLKYKSQKLAMHKILYTHFTQRARVRVSCVLGMLHIKCRGSGSWSGAAGVCRISWGLWQLLHSVGLACLLLVQLVHCSSFGRLTYNPEWFFVPFQILIYSQLQLKQVNSEGFWRWCIALGRIMFSDFVHGLM
jgi:hypothetical protein